jgi:hypothetical protein
MTNLVSLADVDLRERFAPVRDGDELHIKVTVSNLSGIPLARRPVKTKSKHLSRTRQLHNILLSDQKLILPCNSTKTGTVDGTFHPTILLLNPTSIAKPNALEHLKADVLAFNPDIVVLVESWLKPYHPDTSFNIPGFIMFRRDRIGRKGGGIAIYCRPTFKPAIFIPATPYETNFELLWITVSIGIQCYFIGGLYHPQSRDTMLINY